MRVIAGKAKGHRLSAPRGLDVRPTSDRAKEAIFNILGEKVIGSSVLDLFAGTGNLGIEALSRGAKEAVFVDRDLRAEQSISKNLKKTCLEPQAELLNSEVRKALKHLKSQEKQFDLIFLDPPYKIDLAELETILSAIVDFKLLTQTGLIIIEHSSKIDILLPEELEQVELRKYGDTTWSIVELKT